MKWNYSRGNNGAMCWKFQCLFRWGERPREPQVNSVSAREDARPTNFKKFLASVKNFPQNLFARA